jgi:hypothetical protein
LVDQVGELHPDAYEVFKEIFYRFASNVKGMSKEDAAAFIRNCLGDQCNLDDFRIKSLFEKYDTDRDDILLLEDFMSFYLSSCRDKPRVVWDNLKNLGYREDFSRIDRDLKE